MLAEASPLKSCCAQQRNDPNPIHLVEGQAESQDHGPSCQRNRDPGAEEYPESSGSPEHEHTRQRGEHVIRHQVERIGQIVGRQHRDDQPEDQACFQVEERGQQQTDRSQWVKIGNDRAVGDG